MRCALPLAWGVATFSAANTITLVVWTALGVLYVVHDVTLSTAIRRERARQMKVTMIDGVQLSPEDAEKIREILLEARTKQGENPMQ